MTKIKKSSMIQLLTAYLTICVHVESIDKVISKYFINFLHRCLKFRNCLFNLILGS